MSNNTFDTETPVEANAVLVIGTLEVKIDGVASCKNGVHAIFSPLRGKSNSLDLDLRPMFRQPEADEHVALRIEDELWLYLDKGDPEGKLSVVAFGNAALTFPWIFLGGARLMCWMDGRPREMDIDTGQPGGPYDVIVDLAAAYQTLRSMIDVAKQARGGIAPSIISVTLP